MILFTKDDIQNIALFGGLDEEKIDYLFQNSSKLAVGKGKSLFLEKDKVNDIYIVLKGKVSLFRLSELGQKRVIFILDKDEIINEVIFDDLPASINCVAFEDSIILGINRQALLYIMSKDFQLTQAIMDSMGKKIRRMYRQIKNTLPLRVDKKLAAKLWKLSRDYGVEVGEGILINLDLSVTYLSYMLGTSRETVSRCISDFQKQGFISYKYNKIVVKDRNRLSIYFREV